MQTTDRILGEACQAILSHYTVLRRFLILSSGLQFLPQLISVFSHGYCFHDKHVLIFFSSNAVFYCCGCCNKYHSVVVKRVDIHFLKILKAGISESRCPQRYFSKMLLLCKLNLLFLSLCIILPHSFSVDIFYFLK